MWRVPPISSQACRGSGSPLLAALLRQNRAVHANVTSPVGAMMSALLSDMSAGDESAVSFIPAQREAVPRGLFVNHRNALDPGRTLFDTNRGWTG